MRRRFVWPPIVITALAGFLALVPSTFADARHPEAHAETGWSANARGLRGENGKRFTFVCSAQG